MLRIVGVIVVGYVLLVLLIRALEPRLVFAPGSARHLTPPPPSLGLDPETVRFRAEDGVALSAWAMRPIAPTPVARWLLICHGNAGNLSEGGRDQHYAGLRALGLGILAFDYRGYGESEGSPDERGVYLDAVAAYRYLRDSLGVPPARIVIFGHSLGSAVAVELASREPAAGLILDGALLSAVARGQEIYPWLPVRLIARNRFESDRKIGRLTLPKLFLHARADDVVPIDHGERLFALAPEPKQFVPLGGGHGDAFLVDSAGYYGAVAAFMRDLQVPRP
ncbi:MAG TPA: alpha/beta hydrolase [Gemmatimonadales bacterium]|nr:alpha/beta hydrolase [Gemmatimonadales bacterium]